MQIAILEPNNFSDAALAALRGVGTVTLVNNTNKNEALARSAVLFVRLAYFIDKEFLGRSPCLRVICSPTTGHTHLDISALHEREVTLLSLQGETTFLRNIRATPEHTLGLMLALLRNYRLAMQSPQNAHWDRDRCRGEELFRMPIGIIGYGRVGRRVASYLDAFEAEVGYYDIANVDAPGHHRRFGSIAGLIESSRMIVLAASFADCAPPILGRAEFLAMKGMYFVNTSRGELVDEQCLLQLIAQGHFAGVAVDTIGDETSLARRQAWLEVAARHDVILTPHIAGATVSSMHATEIFLVEKLIRFLKLTHQAI